MVHGALTRRLLSLWCLRVISMRLVTMPIVLFIVIIYFLVAKINKNKINKGTSNPKQVWVAEEVDLDQEALRWELYLHRDWDSIGGNPLLVSHSKGYIDITVGGIQS